MKCQKTGLNFCVVGREFEGTFVGDMFSIDELGCFIVRGIPSGTTDIKPDIIFIEHNDIYIIESISEDFYSFWRKWNGGMILGVKTIIDDTRFF